MSAQWGVEIDKEDGITYVDDGTNTFCPEGFTSQEDAEYENRRWETFGYKTLGVRQRVNGVWVKP